MPIISIPQFIQLSKKGELPKEVELMPPERLKVGHVDYPKNINLLAFQKPGETKLAYQSRLAQHEQEVIKHQRKLKQYNQQKEENENAAAEYKKQVNNLNNKLIRYLKKDISTIVKLDVSCLTFTSDQFNDFLKSLAVERQPSLQTLIIREVPELSWQDFIQFLSNGKNEFIHCIENLTIQKNLPIGALHKSDQLIDAVKENYHLCTLRGINLGKKKEELECALENNKNVVNILKNAKEIRPSYVFEINSIFLSSRTATLLSQAFESIPENTVEILTVGSQDFISSPEVMNLLRIFIHRQIRSLETLDITTKEECSNQLFELFYLVSAEILFFSISRKCSNMKIEEKETEEILFQFDRDKKAIISSNKDILIKAASSMSDARQLVCYKLELSDEFYQSISGLDQLIKIKFIQCINFSAEQFSLLFPGYNLLTYLTLNNCQLDDEGLRCLVPNLKQCQHLSKIDLSYNHISGQVLDTLKKLLIDNRTISSVDIQKNSLIDFPSDNAFTEGDLQIFLKSLQKGNTALTSVTIINVDPVDDYVNYFSRGERVRRKFYKKTQDLIDNFGSSTKTKVDELLNAAQNGNLEKVKEIVRSKKISLYAKNLQTGDTALHVAVKYNRTEIVKFLLQHCHPYIRNKKGETIEDLAAQSNCNDLSQMINDAAENLKKEKHKRPADECLTSPLKKPRLTTLPILWGQPIPTTAATISNDTSLSPLLIFAQRGDLLLFQKQREEVAPSPNSPLEVNGYGQTALWLAVANGKVEMAQYLLDYLPDKVNQPDAMKLTPLHAACQSFLLGHDPFPSASLLLARQAFPNSLDGWGRSPLFMLVGGFEQTQPLSSVLLEKALGKTARLLLQRGADPNALFNDPTLGQQITILHKAIALKHYRIAAALLDHPDCDPNIQDAGGYTALHIAVVQRDVLGVRLLVCYNKVDLRKSSIGILEPLQLAENIHSSLSSEAVQQREDIEKIILLLQNTRESRPGTADHLQWTENLTIRYQKHFNEKASVEFQADDIHHALNNSVTKLKDESPEGNQISLRMGFIISINYQLAEYFSIDSSQFEGAIAIEHPSNYREAVAERAKNAPDNLLATAEEQPKNGKLLRPEKIVSLPDDSDPNFARLFHHTEQKALNWLERAEAREKIAEQLSDELEKKNIDLSQVKLKAMFIEMHSRFPICANCEASLLGAQSPHSAITKGMQSVLLARGFLQNELKPFRLIVRATIAQNFTPTASSAEKPSIAILQTLNYSKKWGGTLFSKSLPLRNREATFSSRGKTRQNDINTYFTSRK